MGGRTPVIGAMLRQPEWDYSEIPNRRARSAGIQARQPKIGVQAAESDGKRSSGHRDGSRCRLVKRIVIREERSADRGPCGLVRNSRVDKPHPRELLRHLDVFGDPRVVRNAAVWDFALLIFLALRPSLDGELLEPESEGPHDIFMCGADDPTVRHLLRRRPVDVANSHVQIWSVSLCPITRKRCEAATTESAGRRTRSRSTS